jgi:hypothetical protein
VIGLAALLLFFVAPVVVILLGVVWLWVGHKVLHYLFG